MGATCALYDKPVVRLQQFQRGFGLGTMMDSTRNLPPAQISGQGVNIHDETWGTYDQSAQSHALQSRHPRSQDQQGGFIKRSPTEEGSPQIRRHVSRSHDDHSTHLVSLSSNVFKRQQLMPFSSESRSSTESTDSSTTSDVRKLGKTSQHNI